MVALSLASLGPLAERRAAAQVAREIFVPCGLRGHAAMPSTTIVTDAGGKPIARFSGAEASVVVAGFSTAVPPRARIETGVGQGGFRVRGFVDASKLPIATTENVVVVPNHVWIGAGRSVTVVEAASDKLRIEKKLASPLHQTFSAFTSCGKLSFGTPVPPGWSPQGDARGFVLRGTSADLYDAVQGKLVTSLYKAAGVPGVLFYGGEPSGVWVRVEYHGEVVLNAWAKTSELSPLPRGETMDQLAPSPSVRNPPRLAIAAIPRLVKAPRELPLRAAAQGGEPIGVIEAGAETYVLDVVAGWASVVPRALDVMPPESGQFWVKKEELGL